MSSLALFVRSARLVGAAALLLACGAIIVAILGEMDRARRLVMAALALGATGLIGSALTYLIQRRRRFRQDRP